MPILSVTAHRNGIGVVRKTKGAGPKTRSGTDDGNEQGDQHLNNLNKRLSTIAEMNAV